MDGLIGAIGTLASFAMDEEEQYYVVAEAEVEGSLLVPSQSRSAWGIA